MKSLHSFCQKFRPPKGGVGGIAVRDSILNRILRCPNFASKKTKWIKLNAIGVYSETSSLFVLVGNRPAPFAFIAKCMAFPNQ